MKNFKYHFLLLAFVVMSASMLTSCEEDKDDSSNEEVVKAQLISATWKVSSVTVDGANQSNVYAGLNVSFTSSGFTSINGEPVWPSSGTWQFTSDDAEAIRRNDGLIVEIISISDSQLKLGLTWEESTIGSGRSASVSGEHVFTFGK